MLISKETKMTCFFFSNYEYELLKPNVTTSSQLDFGIDFSGFQLF